MDLILLFMALYTVKCLKFRNKEPGELSAGALLPIRGITAVVVILHHMSQRTSGGFQYLFRYFNFVGYLAVAIFFAISGYALSHQYAKNPDYLNGFLKKRYPPLLLPYLLATLAILTKDVLCQLNCGNDALQYLKWSFFDMFRNGNTILPFSWYVEMIALLYLLFYFLYKFCKSDKVLRFILCFLGMAIIVCICIRLDYDTWWYNSIFAFLLGILYFEYSETKYYQVVPEWVGLTISFVCFTVCFFANLFFDSLLIWELSACTFAVSVFQFSRVVKIESKLLNYLGSRSYEIYLSQGIAMSFCEYARLSENSVIYTLLTIISSVLFGELLYRVDHKLLKGFAR